MVPCRVARRLTATGKVVGGPRTEAYGATRRADGAIVVVGRELVGPAGRGAAWVQTDDGTFARAGGGDAFAGGSQVSVGGDDAQFVNGLAIAGADVLAAGTEAGDGRYAAALWHSGDAGATWERIEAGRPFAADRYAVATSVVMERELASPSCSRSSVAGAGVSRSG